ncbi:MAG: hypothetical protein JO264_10990 [Acidisphaera sp.]|nr:hypothetical protein [Acidisphaera sp.]
MARSTWLCRAVLWLAMALAWLVPLTAQAAPPTEEQARRLEQDLRAWLAETFGAAPSPDRPVQIAPEGDHYRLSVPIGGLFGVPGGADLTVTATMQERDDGTWSLDDIRTPSPSHFTLELTTRSNGKEAPAPLPTDVTLQLQDQKAHALFDPAYGTPSSFTGSYGAFDLHLQNALLEQTQHFDSYTVNATLRPAAAGRLDVLEDVVGQGFATAQHDTDGHDLRMSVRRVQLASHLDAVNRTRFVPVMQAAMQLSGAMLGSLGAAHGHAPGVPPLDRSSLRALLLALRDVAAGGEIDESLDGMHVVAAGHSVDLDHVAVGIGADAPDGMLNAHLALSLDGLSVPELPPRFSDYLPRHIVLRPAISGVSVADLTRMGMTATEPDFDPSRLAPEVDDLFSHGGITIGFDSLEFDIGPASFDGSGKLLVASLAEQTGRAEIHASGFDALMKRVQGDPLLSKGFPVLAVIRQLARPAGDKSGDRLAWDVAYDGSRLTVNGTDLSAMLGRGK